ncbi:MAG: hypothetical protein OEW58_12810 [Gammaproteobacteria bacterium]|nr:hypothetical protein [Gammaproteobacteria bacterium]
MNKRTNQFLLIAALTGLPMMAAHAGEGNHHAALFGGATITSDYTDPTVGLEYEYRTNLWERRIGLGLVAERIAGDYYDMDLFFAGVVVHPWKDSKFNISVGHKDKNGSSYTVARVGAGYDFHYKQMSFGPVYNFDSVDGTSAHVLGIAVGVGF